MAMLFGILFSGLAVAGVYKFLTNPNYRTDFAKEFNQDPWFALFTLFGALCVIVLIWGLLIPPLANLRIPFGRRDSLPLWGVAGLGLIAWSVIGIIGSSMRSKRR
jgi:hypothetical protein